MLYGGQWLLCIRLYNITSFMPLGYLTNHDYSLFWSRIIGPMCGNYVMYYVTNKDRPSDK